MKDDLLACPDCAGAINVAVAKANCTKCKKTFSVNKGVVVLSQTGFAEKMQKKKPNWYTLPQKSVRKIYQHQHNIRKKLLRDAVQDIINSSKNKRVTLVDIGCGDGNNIEELSDLSDRLVLYGVDYNFLRLVRAKRSTPKANFILADANKNAIRNGQVDIILLNHVIEHVEEDVALLKTLRRYLRPGGYLLLGTPQEGRFLYKMRNRVLEPYILFRTDHVHFYTDEELKKKIRSAGYDIKLFHYLNYGFPHSVIDRYLRTSKKIHDSLESFGRKHFEKSAAGALWVIAQNKPKSSKNSSKKSK